MPATIKEMFVTTAERFGSETALLHKVKKEWKSVRYDTLLQRTQCVSEILAQQGVAAGDRVGLWRENHPDWAAWYLGIVCLGAVAVPIDAKLRPQEAVHILNDCQAKLLLAGPKFYSALREVEASLEHLHTVIMPELEQVDTGDDKLVYQDYGLSVETVWEAATGVESAFAKAEVRGDDLASLIYTSGTTGRAKGVMLTHGNFMANVNGASLIWPFDETDNFLLVLPLHHAFAFTGNFLLPLSVGATISFVQNLRTVWENMREVSPTFFMGVPLLLEKMHNKLEAGLKANKSAQLLMKVGLGKVVGKKIVEKLGGRLKIIITGAAPCDPDIITGFRKLGIHVLEGYGLTETAPVLAVNLPGKAKPGTVGTAFTDVELRICDPNEQGIGEIAARGPNIMRGYFNNPEATAEVFDGDWFLTGDLGVFDDEGFLKITGRKKSLIVNREGKNIYPEEVEMAVNQHAYILESLVLGYQESADKVGERVGIIVVPDLEALNKDFPDASMEEREAVVKDAVKEQVSALSDYKRPRRLHIRNEEFQKTSTQKPKRYLYNMDMEDLDA